MDEVDAATEALLEKEGFNVNEFKCPGCFDKISSYAGLCLPSCQHNLCKSCFERMAKTCIENKQLVSCPMCHQVIPGWILGKTLGVKWEQDNAENEQLHIMKSLQDGLRLWSCPSRDCKNIMFIKIEDWDEFSNHPHDLVDEDFVLVDTGRLVFCPGCSKWICIRCRSEDHPGTSCAMVDSWKLENASNHENFQKLLNKGEIKLCPACQSPITKISGCNSVTCSVCVHPDKMCWETGKPRYGPKSCGGGHNCH